MTSKLNENRRKGLESVRKFLAAAVAAASMFGLSGCSALSAPTLESDLASIKPACEQYTTGDAASKITAKTVAGAAPVINIPAGISSEKIETNILSEGKGIKFTGNQLVTLEYIGLNGSTNKAFQTSKFDGSDAASEYIKAGQQLDFCHALSGVKEGSLVAVYVPPMIAHNGKGIAELKVGPSDSIVFIFKLVKVYLSKAIGSEQPQRAGFPSVVRAVSGQPGVTFLKSDAPTSQKTSVLIQGHGDALKLGQTITVHYTGFVWSTKVKFDSSWDNGQPAQFKLDSASLIPGFVDSLKGQKIGSQIITVIPPEKAYGAQEQQLIPANSTLVFVIDILGATDAK